MKHLIFGFLFIGLFPGNLTAQVSDTSADFSYVLADVRYISDAVFMGRRDSIEAPYIFPSLGYYHKSGFFGNASASYLVKSGEERIDLFLLSAGYIYSRDPFSAGLSATKYFFDDESYNVQSEIEADLTALLSYDFKAAEVSLGLSAYLGKSSPDLVASLMLEHIFYGLDKKLLLTPRLSLSGGTQYFYEEYYNTSRLGNSKGPGNSQQGPGSGPGGMLNSSNEMMNIQLAEASEFNLLDVEIRLPLQFYHKSFIFSFTPAIAFPLSPASVTTEDEAFQEDLENVFYWSAGISYWLKTD